MCLQVPVIFYLALGQINHDKVRDAAAPTTRPHMLSAASNCMSPPSPHALTRSEDDDTTRLSFAISDIVSFGTVLLQMACVTLIGIVT